jgi:hypothetical protein
MGTGRLSRREDADQHNGAKGQEHRDRQHRHREATLMNPEAIQRQESENQVVKPDGQNDPYAPSRK